MNVILINNAAKLAIEEGITTLKQVFTTIIPSVTYHTINAKCRLLQMSLVAIHLQCWELYLLEKVDVLDYEKLVKFMNTQI